MYHEFFLESTFNRKGGVSVNIDYKALAELLAQMNLLDQPLNAMNKDQITSLCNIIISVVSFPTSGIDDVPF